MINGGVLEMAFSTGKFWLANGQNMWVYIGWGRDMGATWIQASPLPFDTFPTPSGYTQLETSRQQKRFLYANGGTDWWYFALVDNTYAPGWNSTYFTLTGGGNV
jgi:hypothetical protein